ncbi:polysaccharide deacetylase family protein [Rhodococcus sp. ARC_M6]|uniref:polysaccharide deacetylase family protein n=1 Tax=Rhodococcus sp. ARC_M6 TaxID=2928852 RepID=UPI001FB4E770|nr:polysaccharide deacetylase family protein [Rhodococcus sp. ARC_M6]MCJ0906209.1 polysaccharide deacetylase family protein [Rhodococcus sp. ARC_M6]
MDPVTLGMAKADAAKKFAPLGQGSVPRFGRQDTSIVTNFEAGHGWTVQNAGGGTSNLNDTSAFAFGTQSVRLTTAGAGASTIVEKLGIPAIPVGRMYRLWVKVDAPDTLNRVRVMLSDAPAFTSYYTLESFFSSAGIPEVQRPFKAGEWVPISLPWSIAVATGSPVRGSLTNIRVLVNDRSVPATVRLGRLETMPDPVPLFPSGVVSLTYDDTFASAYTVVRPHLDKYGFAGTLFPILERFGQAGYLTTAQCDALAFTSGWEIGAHASTYAKHVQSVTGMTSAERVAEFTTLRAWQQARGYAASSFAYPNGTVDAATEFDLRKFYGTGRLALGRFSATGADEQQNPSIPTRIYAQNPGNLTLAQMKAEVDRAVANKSWLVFVFHDVLTTKVGANDVATADHLALVDYIAASGVAVRTMDQVRNASL